MPAASSNKRSSPKNNKSTAPKSATKAAALSKERIVDAAYEMARENRDGTLSMRKIATHLNVTPMAIYKYFADKEALTAAIIDRHMQRSSLIPKDIDQSDWRAWIKDAFLRMWDAFDDAPSMLQYMSNAISPGPGALQWHNLALKVLIEAGLTPQQALTGHAAMAELATGSAVLMPLRRQGVQQAFPLIWEFLQNNNTDTNSTDTNSTDNSEYTSADNPYHWLMLCGEAMMEDMQDSRNAFVKEIELILDSLALQIDSNRHSGNT